MGGNPSAAIWRCLGKRLFPARQPVLENMVFMRPPPPPYWPITKYGSAAGMMVDNKPSVLTYDLS